MNVNATSRILHFLKNLKNGLTGAYDLLSEWNGLLFARRRKWPAIHSEQIEGSSTRFPNPFHRR